MTTLTATDDLVQQLYRVEGKAEIVGGEIVYLPMPGDFPTYTAEQICYSLRTYERQRKNGRSFGDGNHFIVDLPDRRTFSPDAGYHLGPRAGMRFFDGAPTFAVEVRSEGDYGPAAEREMERKRADYFAAGTLVVWDVDVLSDEAAVRVFRTGDGAQPSAAPSAVYGRGQTAEAEPAVPGWTLAVDELLDTGE